MGPGGQKAKLSDPLLQRLGLGAALQADDPAERPDRSAGLFRYVFDIDHGLERR